MTRQTHNESRHIYLEAFRVWKASRSYYIDTALFELNPPFVVSQAASNSSAITRGQIPTPEVATALARPYYKHLIAIEIRIPVFDSRPSGPLTQFLHLLSLGPFHLYAPSVRVDIAPAQGLQRRYRMIWEYRLSLQAVPLKNGGTRRLVKEIVGDDGQKKPGLNLEGVLRFAPALKEQVKKDMSEAEEREKKRKKKAEKAEKNMKRSENKAKARRRG